MVFLKDWEDFEMAAENMYLKNSSNCRYSMKYIHSKGQLLLKLTDNVKVENVSLFDLETKVDHNPVFQ